MPSYSSTGKHISFHNPVKFVTRIPRALTPSPRQSTPSATHYYLICQLLITLKQHFMVETTSAANQKVGVPCLHMTDVFHNIMFFSLC